MKLYLYEKQTPEVLARLAENYTVVEQPKPMTRAERRAEKRRVAANRRNLMRAMRQDHKVELSDNELAERHPFDCGQRCLMCHGEKILGAGARRQREEREALTLEDAAYDERVKVRFQRHYI